MKTPKRISCVILTIVLVMTAFMVNGNTAEAKGKSAEYYFHTYDVKTFKKSNGKLTIKCRKNGWLAYTPSGTNKDLYTKKITYKIAKGCKWRFIDNDKKTKKASYESVRKLIKWDSGDWENPNRIHMKVKNGKIVKIIVYRYYG